MPSDPENHGAASGVGPAAARRLIEVLAEPSSVESAHPVVPGYVVEARLGGGGGGEVFRARRDRSDRPVALKIMARSLAGGAAAQRAWRELDVLAGLHLPAVPRVLDYGLFEGRLFIATEFVDGRTLDEHCGALPRRERVELLARVADAVQSLHEHGVIHRDLKPANVLVDAHGDPVVIDMGLASIAAGDPGLSITADGVPLGSPAFMAPEQARGERGSISVRSDVYGLGATAMVVLTGRSPHGLTWERRAPNDAPPPADPEASTSATPAPRAAAAAAPDISLADVLRRTAFEPPADPRTMDATLPKPLAAVLAKATAFAATERYASAGDFAADLRRWLRGEPVEAVPAGWWRRGTRWVARHPVLTTAAACCSLLFSTLGLTYVALWFVALEPSMIRIVENARAAELVSRAGNVLYRWEGDGDGAVTFAQLAARPGESGGEKVALLIIRDSTKGEHDRQLVAYDASNPETELWIAPGRHPDEPNDPKFEGIDEAWNHYRNL
ncbi:MAG: serine/threonine protein kinase [Phycisphaerales bacterium]|nr:serine/threonine protein kinase [Phycisphaerales bacterium]